MTRDRIEELRRWEDSGAHWQVVARTPGRLTIALLRCDGGEEVERFVSVGPGAAGVRGVPGALRRVSAGDGRGPPRVASVQTPFPDAEPADSAEELENAEALEAELPSADPALALQKMENRLVRLNLANPGVLSAEQLRKLRYLINFAKLSDFEPGAAGPGGTRGRGDVSVGAEQAAWQLRVADALHGPLREEKHGVTALRAAAAVLGTLADDQDVQRRALAERHASVFSRGRTGRRGRAQEAGHRARRWRRRGLRLHRRHAAAAGGRPGARLHDRLVDRVGHRVGDGPFAAGADRGVCGLGQDGVLPGRSWGPNSYAAGTA